jgi:hypothetical protein
MRGSGFAREARRRPELDLLVGPLEAATMETNSSRSDDPVLEQVDVVDPTELPPWREDG